LAADIQLAFDLELQGEKTMSNRNPVMWLILGVLSLPVAMRSEDSASCSNATLHGSYAFHATGERFAAVARFTFDGRGGLTATFFGRSPGNPFGPIEFTGTYSVSPDCIVTDEWLDSIHHSVVYGKGTGYFILNSSPDGDPTQDTVNSGEGRRQ
jgi:hypothetical protein